MLHDDYCENVMTATTLKRGAPKCTEYCVPSTMIALLVDDQDDSVQDALDWFMMKMGMGTERVHSLHAARSRVIGFGAVWIPLRHTSRMSGVERLRQ